MSTEQKHVEYVREQEQKYIEEMRFSGFPEEEIEARCIDRDLWIVDPNFSRADILQGEEGVRQWCEARDLLGDLAEAALQSSLVEARVNDALFHLIWDASDRADEALRRAEVRLEESKTAAE
jgi:hypothetical protein